MTPGPTIPPAVSVEAPLYAVDLPVIPLLLAVVLIVALVLVLRRRWRDRAPVDGA